MYSENIVVLNVVNIAQLYCDNTVFSLSETGRHLIGAGEGAPWEAVAKPAATTGASAHDNLRAKPKQVHFPVILRAVKPPVRAPPRTAGLQRNSGETEPSESS
ncbi:hypothetical protein MHYP_G00254370 [Metynnis hypsauchen]